MIFDVPHLSNADIEAEANALLQSFENKYGKVHTLATPLEEIIENHLGLVFEITDLGHPDILGQLSINQNLISVSSTLDPSSNPHYLGRFNFTLAHEAGHQVLHRPLVEALIEQAACLDDAGEEQRDIIMCRIEAQSAPIEVQANQFSSSLLLPWEKVIAEFMAYTGKKSLAIQPFLRVLRVQRDFMNRAFPDWRYIPSDEEVLKHAFRELADKFQVSMQAMVIRLKGLGLLYDVFEEEMTYA